MRKSKRTLFAVLLSVIMVLVMSTPAYAQNENLVEQDVQNQEVVVEIVNDEVISNHGTVEIIDEDTPLAGVENSSLIYGLLVVIAILIVSYIVLKKYVRNSDESEETENEG